MTLELLKKQMEDMDTKILKLTTEIDKKSKLIGELQSAYEKINLQLETEKSSFNALENNKKYLIEVKNETESNYKQINDAAATLLEILKSKTDKI